MEINASNFWIRLYFGFYEKYPKTFCGLFWKLLFVILFVLVSPLVLIITTFRVIKEPKSYDFYGLEAACMVHIVLDMCSFAMAAVFLKENESLNWWVVFLGFISATLIALFAICIVFGIGYLSEYIEDRVDMVRVLNSNKPEKKPNVLWESIKAIKSKVCPTITIIKK